jgi:hypothetical protein
MSGKTAEVKKFYYKIYRSRFTTILAVCDKDVVGKRVERGEVVLYAKPEFYKGEEIGEEVKELFKEATVINLMGKRIVELAIKEGWVDEENVLEIEGIKHAQVYKV